MLPKELFYCHDTFKNILNIRSLFFLSCFCRATVCLVCPILEEQKSVGFQPEQWDGKDLEAEKQGRANP